MKRIPWRVRGLLMVMVVSALDAPLAWSQTAADVFDGGTLQEIRLFINSRDLRELRDRYQEDIYFPADFHWRDLRVRNVGVRMRGFGSRNPIKPGLRVDFNRYVTGQEFLGLDALVLDNVVQDSALIRERVSLAFFERMGQPAPRVSLGRLYINNAYQGVYAIIESVDRDFVRRTLGETDGYLFEYRWVGEYFGEDLGDDLQEYQRRFEAQTHQTDPESVLYAPIRELFRVANEPDEGLWRDRIGVFLDLPQFVTHVAIEEFLTETDGVNGHGGMANFFLYRPASRTTHRLLPWDKDKTFEHPETPIFTRADLNVLLRRALAFPDLRTLYLDVLEACARRALEDDWLVALVRQASSLIADAAHEDRLKFTTNEEFDAATEFMKDYARRRPLFVLQEVSRAR
jgi:spore coat protein CotH